MADRTQWVNLDPDKASRFVDGTSILTAEQVGRVVTPRLSFKESIPASAKVTIAPDGPAAPYSEKESTRWTGFQLWLGLETVKPDGEKAVDAPHIALPQAGGYRYKLEAKDAAGNKVAGDTILITRRRIDYHLAATVGVFTDPTGKPLADTGPDVIQGIVDGIAEELRKPDLAIDMVHVGSDGTLAPVFVHDIVDRHERVVSELNRAELVRCVEGLCKFIDPRVSVAIAWVPWLPRKKQTELYFSIGHKERASSRGARVSWRLDETSRRLEVSLGKSDFLWHGLRSVKTDAGRAETDEDQFLVELEISLDVNSAPEPITKGPTYGAVHGSPHSGQLGGYSGFSVDLDQEWETLRGWNETDSMSIKATFYVVSSWGLGISFAGSNVIAIADRSRWEVRKTAAKAQTLLHELGHRFGLAANGDGDSEWASENRPDMTKGNYYDSATPGAPPHIGAHCRAGVPSFRGRPEEWTPNCVMFGEAHDKRSGAFCPACREDLRLADLTGTVPKT